MNRQNNRNPLKAWIAVLVTAVAVILSYGQIGSQSDNVIPENVLITDLKISQHAACRMNCRHISKDEILEVLKEGKVNHSRIRTDSRGKTYAYEGKTQDGQEVRIIVAPYEDHIVVVTVIDLRNEWNCDC